jgi:hypothetical protein
MANASRISRTARNVAVEPTVAPLAIVEPTVAAEPTAAAFRFPKAEDFSDTASLLATAADRAVFPTAPTAEPTAAPTAEPTADNGALTALVATLTSEVAALKANVSEPKAERKSNSQGVKDSWLVAETRKARLTRNSVTLSVNGAAPIGYDSFPKAFDANGKPGGAGKFTKNRLELKEKGVLTLVNEEGTSYRFELVSNA